MAWAATGASETRETTFAKARQARALKKEGLSRLAIAERMKVGEERVRQYLQMPYLAETAADQSETRVAPTSKRMTERMLLHRAYTAMRTIKAFRLLNAETREFWLETVLEIREAGDGICLTFGEAGDLYRSQDEFLKAFGRTAADLENLFDRELLVEVEAGGVAMPFRFGLRPAEKLAAAPNRVHRFDPRDPPLPPMAMPTPGAAPGPNFGPNFGQTFGVNGQNISVVSTQTDPSFGQIAAISTSRGEGTTTKESEENHLLTGGGTGSCAPSENFGQGQKFGADQNFAGAQKFGADQNFAGDKNFAAPAGPSDQTLSLAGRVQEAAHYQPKVPAAALPSRDLDEVAGWIALGAPDDLVLREVRADMDKPNPKPVYGLKLFTGSIKAAWDLEKAKAARKGVAASPAAITSTLTPADKAANEARAKLERRTGPLIDWWMTHRTGARPPLTGQLMRQCDAGYSVPAFRWLAAMEAARKADEPCLLLPEFDAYLTDPAAWEERMLACEEALAAPGETADG